MKHTTPFYNTTFKVFRQKMKHGGQVKTLKVFYVTLLLALASLSCTQKMEFNNPLVPDVKILPPTEVAATPSADTLVTVKWKEANTFPANTAISYFNDRFSKR